MHTLEILQQLKNPPLLAPSSGEASIGAHVLEINEQLSCQSHTMEEILGAHSINDDFWGGTNPGDVSINPTNSEEMMAGSHITQLHTQTQKISST